MRRHLVALALAGVALAGCAEPTVTTRPAPTVTVTETVTAPPVTMPPVTVYPEPTSVPTSALADQTFECNGYIVGGGVDGAEPYCADEPREAEPTVSLDTPYTGPEWDYTLPEVPFKPLPTEPPGVVYGPDGREASPNRGADLPPVIPTITANPRNVNPTPTLP